MRKVVSVAFGAIGLSAALLVACDGQSTPPATTPSGPPDYTIVAKNIYRGQGADGKSGQYLTIILFGEERETQVSGACYTAADLGTVLARDCR